MTSTKPEGHIGGHRREVDFQKLGPALVIASSLVLAIRTARWAPTHSDGLANMEWEKELSTVSALRKLLFRMSPHVARRCFQTKDVPWHVAADDEVPR